MATGSINQKYPIGDWITSILTAPLMLVIIFAIQSGVYWNAGFISVYILTLFAAVVLSLPTIFLHKLAFKELVIVIESELLIKIFLTAIALCCMSFTFFIVIKFADAGFEYDDHPILCFLLYYNYFRINF